MIFYLFLAFVIIFAILVLFIFMPIQDRYYQRRIDEAMERYLRSCAKSRSKDKDVIDDQQEEKE